MNTIRIRPILFWLALLITGVILFVSGRASAQSGERSGVIQLSSSGFEQARSISFSSDGSLLAVGGISGIYLVDPWKLSIAEFIETGTWARSVAFAPDRPILAGGLFDGRIGFWNIPDAHLTRTLEDPEGWVRSISFSADGSLIASASDDDTLRVWQVGNDTPILTVSEHTTGLRAVALSPDGTLVVGAPGDNTVRVWSVLSGELIYTLEGHTDWVRCLAFSPDGQLLASGSFDKTIRLWEMSDGRLEKTFKGHTSSVLGIAFSPDGQLLASGSVDETVRVWEVINGAQQHVLQGHNDFVYSVAFSPDSQVLASSSGDNTVRLWELQSIKTDVAPPIVHTPSDCRACHHNRGKIEPARVIELSCENCHADGISLSWCTGFPRSSQIEQQPVTYHAVEESSGVPVNHRDLAVVIASPGNWETLYVRGQFMAPEFISGKVFYKDPFALPAVEIQLDIISNGETTTSLVTHPAENGTFNFDVAINLTSPPPHLSRPGTRQCLVCHGDFVPQAGLPEGDVHLVVTAVAPDGQRATDDRWIRVDSSKQAVIPIQVLDAETGQGVEGLSVEAATILYEWRDRYALTISGPNGEAQFDLEYLSQAHTTYTLSIPPQVMDDVLYASPDSVEVVLEPDANSYPMLTLTAQAVSGRIQGELGGLDVSSSGRDAKVWAIQLPAGPAYQTLLQLNNKFLFEKIPVSQYMVVADVPAFQKQGIYAHPAIVNLLDSTISNVSLSPESGRFLSGSVTTSDGNMLPFAWVKIGDTGRIQALDAATGEFLITDLPYEAAFVTVSAPGYYSLPQSVKTSTETLDVQLVPRPDLHIFDWGKGQVVMPPETIGSADGLNFDLESGWLWGEGSSSQPLEIQLPGRTIYISNASFALEQPVGAMGWLYIWNGQAEVRYDSTPEPVTVKSGQMLAMTPGAQPLPLDAAIAAALHPSVNKLPVFETFEPSIGARLKNWLVKTGIGAMQTITFITYILSLVTLIAIPALVLFSYQKKRRSSSNSQEML